MKTGSESIETALCRRRILFVEFVARVESKRLPKFVMFSEWVGDAGCVGGQEKEWMGCFLDDLRALGINADQWTTAAQDGGKWHRTAEQGAERFMAKVITAEKVRAGLRHAVVCPNVTGRTKERIFQRKRPRAGLLAIVDLATSDVNLYPPGVWFADVMSSFSRVTVVCLKKNMKASRPSEHFPQSGGKCQNV